MSAKGSGSLLAQAARDLSNSWQQTKASWADVKSAEFEQKYLEGLPSQVAQAAAAIEEIEILIQKIRSDCE